LEAGSATRIRRRENRLSTGKKQGGRGHITRKGEGAQKSRDQGGKIVGTTTKKDQRYSQRMRKVVGKRRGGN